MKKIFKTVIPILLSITAVTGLSSCSSGTASLLREPAVASAEENGGYTNLLPSLKSFASAFGGDYFSSSDEKNAVISPISAYMALSLASECAAGDTKTELLNALDIDGETLKSGIPYLYSELNKTFTGEADFGGKTETGRITLTNSVWYDSGIKSLKSDCLDTLSSYYGAYSYQADFSSDNTSANKAVRSFIKEKTNGLIDKDWRLSTKTLIALINTLYLKDIWNSYGDSLSLYGKDDFLNADNSTKNTEYYSAYYNPGKVAEGENCSYFYASTRSGIKITFIKPDAGVSVNSVLNDENIQKILSASYETSNSEKLEIYETRCIFPEFTIETDEDIVESLKQLGVNKLFATDECDFSSVTDEGVYCNQVRHAAKLTVDKVGIEGAAVTLMAMDGVAAPNEEYTTVYSNFILDRSFGVIVCYRNIPLFIGAVNKL